MAIIEVSVVPIGTATTSLSSWVTESLRVLQKRSDLNYKLTPMGTIIEGDLDQALRLVRQMHEAPFKTGIRRVITTISVDDRRDKSVTLQGKVDSVMKKLKE